MIKPLNNHCLIEVIDENEGIIGSDKAASVQKGVLRSYGLIQDHLTTSAGYKIDNILDYDDYLKNMEDKTVYWQEYADAGAKFDVDGKQYVLVPFYRLIGYEENPVLDALNYKKEK